MIVTGFTARIRLVLLAALVVLLVLVALPAHAAPKRPTVTTTAATAVTETTATLNGTVNPQGKPTTALFQWGLTTSYGQTTPSQSVGAGTVALPVSAPIAGLQPGTVYHFRVQATSSAGTSFGADRTFTTATPPPPPPTAFDPATVDGTWALRQVSGVTELNGSAVTAEINHALSFADMRGLSLRWPWRNAVDPVPLMDAGKAKAAAHGEDFSVRFMAGRHTPQTVLDAMGPNYYYTTGTGAVVPKPFGSDGTGGNPVFEAAYADYVGQLATWARANDVRLLHMSWYAKDWAELDISAELRAAPGFTYAGWLAGHNRLIDIALSVAGPDLAVEFPMSGGGPLVNLNGACAICDLTDHIEASTGGTTGPIFIQANGLSPLGDWNSEEAGKDAAAWPQNIWRGKQMIQPQDYDWTAVYAALRNVDPGTIPTTYIEVYTPSFGLANQAQLQAEITNFALNG